MARWPQKKPGPLAPQPKQVNSANKLSKCFPSHDSDEISAQPVWDRGLRDPKQRPQLSHVKINSVTEVRVVVNRKLVVIIYMAMDEQIHT